MRLRGDSSDQSNYRPIYVLPCFLKILQQLMYNRLYKHLSNSKILYPKQFGFQKGHSTDHALLQLVDQIYESFERNEYTIGVFIDLSKAFDTVDHKIRNLRHIWHPSLVVPKLLKQQKTVYSV